MSNQNLREVALDAVATYDEYSEIGDIGLLNMAVEKLREALTRYNGPTSCMNNLREAAQLALEALEHVTESETFYRDPRGDRAGPAIDALRNALAQPESGTTCDHDKEPPLGWMRPDELQKARTAPHLCRVHPEKDKHADMIPVYATPQPPAEHEAELSDEQICEIAERFEASDPCSSFWKEFARAIIAADRATRGGAA